VRNAAALAILCVLTLGCTGSTTPVGSVNSQAATPARTGPVISPPPATAVPPGGPPAFACKDASGGTPGSANVTLVRAGEQVGFDRFVLQFDSQVPAYTVKRQARATFAQTASGQPITLLGSAGVLITVKTASQSGTYSGPTDMQHPEFTILKEARVIGDFEGTVAWGIGLGSAVCERSFILTNPARLVVDFSTTT
jgi:hypothetical protein